MSMSHMNNLLICSLIILLVSCTTIKNVSDSSQFEGDIGIKYLEKNAFICTVDNNAMFTKGLPVNELYENHGFKSCPRGMDVASLLKGAEIKVSEASHSSHFGLVSYTDHWYFVGSADIGGKMVSFYYYLGLTTDGKPPVNYKNNLLWH
ncbi:hypothetical protein [Pseudoalteromonas sp. SG43-3]|uniref:hypothetical protein n=3 Tax=Pseudoalteromonas TaxID=53246 RepID=UPI0016022596|nr:hypothetical protein [Pseudoalteromonas sp. SG43-3]